MSESLEQKRILVTGGATGIGAAVSRALLDAGARVGVVQRSEAELATSLQAAGLAGGVLGLAADLADPEAARSAVDRAAEAWGGLDGLVTNAAVTGPEAQRSLLDYDAAYVERMLAINVGAVIHGSAAAARHMVDQGHGVIVTISSVLAHAPAPAAAVYAATKAAVGAFARGAALELGPHGVRVVTVSPGDIETPVSVAPPAQDGQRAVRPAALGRRGRPTDIAAMVRFLLGPEADYVTGVDVVVDGGFLLT